MDAVTAMAIDRGRKNNKLLVQPQYSPMPVGEMIAVLYCGVHSLMRDIEIDQVPEFQQNFLEMLRIKHQADVIDVLASGSINNEVTDIIEQVAAEAVKALKK
jgi:F-type H+-transporting ATPase subunit alpha